MPTTLLAIDDQEDNLALLKAFLVPQGFRMLTALNGPSGLTLAHAHRPDLVLLDLAMPGMDGFAVLEALRASRATAGIPVIILTAAFLDAAMVERGLALGATEYLTKPIKMDELVVRLRSALRLAAAEKALTQLREDFASMLVHDMRAPLDGIRLALGVVRRQEASGSPRWELLDHALGAVEDLGTLVDDLLHANRLADEGFTAETRPVVLAPLLERAAAAIRPLVVARGLTLTLEVPADLPAVLADPALVKRVLDNLAGNAVKFTETGGLVIAAERDGAQVRIQVADTGPGIPDAAKPRIFDRYFHLKSRSGGFGLGLAFCDKAVQAMQGTIGVTDGPAGGTVFTVTLPLAPDPASGKT